MGCGTHTHWKFIGHYGLRHDRPIGPTIEVEVVGEDCKADALSRIRVGDRPAWTLLAIRECEMCDIHERMVEMAKKA